MTTIAPGMLSHSAATECNFSKAVSALRVWMYDPWSRTPWYVGALTRALQSQGHHVRLCSPSYPLEPEYFRSAGLRPRPGMLDLVSRTAPVFKKIPRPARLLEYAMNTTALAVTSIMDAPQILHQHQCVLLERGWKAELAFLLWCRSRGTRVVHTVHNLLPHDERASHAKLYARLYQDSDALICHDANTARALHEVFDVDYPRIHVIPHGPLFAEEPQLTQEECRAALGIQTDRQVFLALGVLAPYKGTDLLLQAWADAFRSDSGLQRPLLVIAGNGHANEIARIRQIASELEIERETLDLRLAYIPAAQVPLYLKAADVLLYPYREITTSGALLSGLNYRKPIIASDLAAFRPYLTSNENALLFSPGDRAGLSHAISELRTQRIYEALRSAGRNNARLQVQWSEIGVRTAQVYGEVLHRPADRC